MNDDTSPSELERKAEQERARIAVTAEKLRERLSPGQLIDEMMVYFRNSDASSMVHNLKGQVRDNPLAVAMVGAGLAWLMAGKGYHRDTSRQEMAHRPEAWSETGQAPGESEASPYGGYASSDDGAFNIGERLSDAGGAIRGAGDQVRSAAETVGDRASAFARSTGEGARRAVHDLRSSVERSGDMVADLFQREPLIVGAIGVAIGAAIGASLPSTSIEDEYLGPARDRLKDDAGNAIEEGVAQAKETARNVLRTAMPESDAQGPAPEAHSAGERRGSAPAMSEADDSFPAGGPEAGEGKAY